MPGLVGVYDDGDTVAYSLFELAHEQLIGACKRPPHDVSHVVPGYVIAHAVELEAFGPGPRVRRAQGRVFEGSRQGAVQDSFDAWVNDDLCLTKEQLMASRKAERVTELCSQRPDFVHPSEAGNKGVAVIEVHARADR